MRTDNHVIEILMVDDDEGDTFMASEALSESRYKNNLNIVHDGVEALSYLQKEGKYADKPTPDLILLDLNMPRMNGHEVLNWVRGNDALKNVPIVVLTTSDADADILQSYDLKANSFITKPVDMTQFTKVIHHIEEYWATIARVPPRRVH